MWADALQSSTMHCPEPLYLYCPFGPRLCWQFRTWMVDGSHAWINYFAQCFHLPIRETRPRRAAQEAVCTICLVGDSFCSSQSRVSFGRVGRVEQQNIVSLAQPPVVFNTADAESQSLKSMRRPALGTAYASARPVRVHTPACSRPLNSTFLPHAKPLDPPNP